MNNIRHKEVISTDGYLKENYVLNWKEKAIIRQKWSKTNDGAWVGYPENWTYRRLSFWKCLLGLVVNLEWLYWQIGEKWDRPVEFSLEKYF